MAKLNLSDPETFAKVIATLKQVQAEKRSLHVIPSRKRWLVVSERSPNSEKSFPDKAVAIEHATQLAKDSHLDLVVHGRDGSVEERVKFHR